MLENFPIISTAYVLIAIGATYHILLTKDHVRSSIGWIGLVWLSPFLGSLLYYWLGINRVSRKATSLREKPSSEPALAGPVSPPQEIKGASTQSLTTLGKNLHLESYQPGCSVRALINGDDAYPAMLEAIASAKTQVCLSTFIFAADDVGLAFVQALSQAKQRGVEVHVLVDAMGRYYGIKPILSVLKKHGITCARFLPVYTLRFVNLRNHRKIMVVDGQRAFLGGMNIRRSHMLTLNPARPVQDIHFEVRGPVINSISQIFEEDWLFATGLTLALPRWASTTGAGEVQARVIPDGPDENLDRIKWIFLGALQCAQKNIKILTPYFIPDRVLRHTLECAALRGISVEVVIPERSNIYFLDWVMHSTFKRMLSYGIQIYLSPAPFDHSKLFLIDESWASIGSCNWDERSLRLNFEINLECVNKELVSQLNDIFEKKKAQSRKVSGDEVTNVSRFIRLRNNFFRLFSPYA